MKRKLKVGVVTLGCSKNTVDSERLINQFKANEFKIVTDPNKADVVIINTCGFIEAAKEESINSILNAVELKKSGKIKKVIVSGCLSQRYFEELKQEIPEADSFFGTEDYKGILEELGADLKYELLGERSISTPKHYAYLKISEGCDHPCSFCAIPLIRGKYRSFSIEELIVEAGNLAKKGVKELLIIGQDTTEYGIDIYGKRNIAELLRKLSEIKGIEWIKLLYSYPSHFPEDLIDEIASNPKICKYIDIPLQHISDNILKSMRRGITGKRTKLLVEKIKKKIPGITLRTTFITGYPGETKEDFEELCKFVKETGFDRLGVFTYSAEEDTAAFKLEDNVPSAEKNKRKNRLMKIQQKISYKKNLSIVGKTLKVIIDDEESDYYIGRSERDAPEVDGEIIIYKTGKKLKTGNFYDIEIIDCNEYDLTGKIIS